MTQSAPRYRSTETSSLGWPGHLALLAFVWLACWIFTRAPWSYVIFGAVALAELVLARLLHNDRVTIEVTGTLLTRDKGDGVEEFQLSALADASYQWVPFYGSVLIVTWQDGRSLEFTVNRSTRRLRAALRAAIADAHPQGVQTDPGAMRSLHRAGLI